VYNWGNFSLSRTSSRPKRPDISLENLLHICLSLSTDFNTLFKLPESYLFPFQNLCSSQNTPTHQKSFCLLIILLNHLKMSSAVAEREQTIWSPKLNIDIQNKKAKTAFIQRLPTVMHTCLIGWKVGVTAWAVAVIVTLFINIGLAIIGSHSGFDKGIGTLLQGECSKITRYNIVAHLIINVMSTLLLSGSNYSMQCLSAPTRRDIDNAHKQGIALDIGIPSLRNLVAFRPNWKVLMWTLLGISSLPLHLLSVIPSSP
jgi:hypothetical protein